MDKNLFERKLYGMVRHCHFLYVVELLMDYVFMLLPGLDLMPVGQ